MVGPYTIDASVFLNAFNPQPSRGGEGSVKVRTDLRDVEVLVLAVQPNCGLIGGKERAFMDGGEISEGSTAPAAVG